MIGITRRHLALLYLAGLMLVASCGGGGGGNSTPTPPPALGNQTIGSTGFSPNSLTVGGTTVVAASATSGLVVSFSSTTPGICSVAGSTVTGVAAGTCTVAANQAGNSSYNAAPQVTQSITVSSAVVPPPTGALPLSGKISYDFVPSTYNESSRTGRLDFAQTTPRPVRGATLRVMQGTNVLASTTTDNNGNYSLQYTPSGSAALQLVVVAESINPPIKVADNTDQNLIWAMAGALDGVSTSKNLHAGSGWNGTNYVDANRTAAPFAILDSMYTASKAFSSVRAVSFPAFTAFWSPQNTSQSGDVKQGLIGTSYFSPSENAVYILGKEGVDTDEFDNHVIVHEWAHYFQDNLSRSDSPGGKHGGGDVLDPRLSFGEGSASAIAAMVLNDPLYVDTLWQTPTTPVAMATNAETAPPSTDDPHPGVLSENSVIRLLYDLFDSVSTPGSTNESFDQVSVGLGTIFDVFAGPLKTTDAMVTVGSFIAGLKQQSGVSSSLVDTLLANYLVGPITDQWGTGDTTMREMYTDVTAFPQTKTIALSGGPESNTWNQNQYYVFTGNGRQVTVAATSTNDDVGIAVYQAGAKLAEADRWLTGTETLQLATQSGKKYVLVLTGYRTTSGNYNVTVEFTSQ